MQIFIDKGDFVVAHHVDIEEQEGGREGGDGSIARVETQLGIFTVIISTIIASSGNCSVEAEGFGTATQEKVQVNRRMGVGMGQ